MQLESSDFDQTLPACCNNSKGLQIVLSISIVQVLSHTVSKGNGNMKKPERKKVCVES